MSRPDSAASLAPEQQSTIDQKVEQVDAQLNRLEDLISRANRVLAPVMTPEKIVGLAGDASGGEKASTQSPLADQLSSRAYRLERHADDLRALLDRVEV